MKMNIIIIAGAELLIGLLTIIIMAICKAPTLRLKALNKHSIPHIMYTDMENVISNKKKKKIYITKLTHSVD